MMTQEVMVPFAGPPRVLGRPVREPHFADWEKDCAGAADADHRLKSDGSHGGA